MLERVKALLWRFWPYAVALLGTLVLGFILGHRMAPVKTIEKVVTKVETVEKVVTKVEYVKTQQRATRAHVRTEHRPDGTVITDRTTDTDTASQTNSTTRQTDATHAQATEEHSKTTDALRHDWHFAGLIGIGPVYGGHVERRILGPIWLGAWGIGGPVPSAGVSVGFEF